MTFLGIDIGISGTKTLAIDHKAILWNDQRTVAECVEIEKSVGGREQLIGLVINVLCLGKITLDQYV